MTIVNFYTFHTVVRQSYSIKILKLTLEINRKPRVIYLRLKGLRLVTIYCVLKLPQSHCGDHTVQKVEFSIKISLVNVTKSSVFCGFGHIYRRNP